MSPTREVCTKKLDKLDQRSCTLFGDLRKILILLGAHQHFSTRNLNRVLFEESYEKDSPQSVPSSDNLELFFDRKKRVCLFIIIDDKALMIVIIAGASATDGMVVIVQPAPFMRHSVEFSMTLAIPYESFAHSALQKRTFIEKVAALFEDKDTHAISLDSISEGSTIVTWRNTSLPTNICPDAEITRLSEILVKADKSLTDRIEQYMGEEFPVKQITLTPLGMCQGQLTGVYSPENYTPPSEDSRSVGTTSDDYLITCVLPAIIIAAMLLLAGIIACVLYRRRRSGKMSVSEQDDERQSFRSKGIPVIFQDELEEKPDPGKNSFTIFHFIVSIFVSFIRKMQVNFLMILGFKHFFY